MHLPRTLLVELPFQSVSFPNIGLSLVKSVLTNAGFPCDIHYASMLFANKIGVSLYTTIAQDLPHECLFGDYVFSLALHEDASSTYPALRPEVMTRIPDWLWEQTEKLQSDAKEFIEELSRDLISRPYDIFGFNLMFQTLPSIALARAIKRLAPDKIVILGGSHCEASMGVALHRAYPWVDYVCRGEGENIVLQLYQHLSTGTPGIETIDGLVWRRGGVTEPNSKRATPVENLDVVPTPSFDDWVRQLEANDLVGRVGRVSLPLETSRGCWYGEKNHCIFCGLMGESLAFRRKSADRVLNDINSLLKHGIENILAVDLIFPNEYFKTLVPALRNLRLPVSMFYEIKANLNRDQLVALKDAGINQLQPGIESLNSNVLRVLHKGVSAYQNIRLLKWAAELGIGLEWNMLVDIPGVCAEDYDAITAIVPMIMHLRPPTVGCNALRVDRFSPLEFRASDFGSGDLRPAPAYRFVHGLGDELLNDLAYFFDSTWPQSEETFESILRLKVAVRQWHLSKGEVTLVAIAGPDQSMLIFDTRPCAASPYGKLSAAESRVFRLCDGGATLQQLINGAELAAEEVQRILSYLTEMKWVLFIDGRYLGLPTNLTSVFDPARFPDELLGSVAHEIQRTRMRPTWKTIHCEPAPN